MDSQYIITSDGKLVSSDELYHWGIKGMKWGVRRYQNADGTLTAAGRKRYTNADGSLNEKGLKKFGAKRPVEDVEKASEPVPKQKQASDMDDTELLKRVIRLRNEDAYRDLSKKLGYDGPKTELDQKIAEMEKQKKYLELQRDINNLTPKKVSRGKKLVETLYNKVIEPAATEAGKKLLSNYLTELGTKKVKDTLEKEAKKAKKSVDDSYERVKKKEAKKEAKQAAKQTEKNAKRQERSGETALEGVLEGTGASSRKSSSGSSSSTQKPIIDVEPIRETAVTSITTRNTSAGSSWVTSYKDTPVNRLPSSNFGGYLPAPKDDDD